MKLTYLFKQNRKSINYRCFLFMRIMPYQTNRSEPRINYYHISCRINNILTLVGRLLGLVSVSELSFDLLYLNPLVGEEEIVGDDLLPTFSVVNSWDSSNSRDWGKEPNPLSRDSVSGVTHVDFNDTGLWLSHECDTVGTCRGGEADNPDCSSLARRRRLIWNYQFHHSRPYI